MRTTLPKVNYPDHYFIPPIVLGIGFLLVQLGNNKPWGELVNDEKAMLSLASSMGCTLVVMLTVAASVRLLDQSYGWRQSAWRVAMRIVLQLFFGVLLQLLIAIGWNYFFFNYMGVLHKLEEYGKTVLPAAAGFIVIWNLFYIGYYLYAVPAGKAQQVLTDANELITDAPPITPPQPYDERDIMHFTAVMAYFSSENKKTIGHFRDGHSKELSWSVKRFAQLLADGFFIVRSGVLVNKNAIQTVKYTDGQYTVYLKLPYEDTCLIVAKERKTAFRDWWDGSITTV